MPDELSDIRNTGKFINRDRPKANTSQYRLSRHQTTQDKRLGRSATRRIQTSGHGFRCLIYLGPFTLMEAFAHTSFQTMCVRR